MNRTRQEYLLSLAVMVQHEMIAHGRYVYVSRKPMGVSCKLEFGATLILRIPS